MSPGAAVFLAFWCACVLPGLADLLPGGGMSVFLPSDQNAVVAIPNFTALANATSYSMECWAYSMSPVALPSLLTFATELNTEYWSFAAGDELFVSLDGKNDKPTPPPSAAGAGSWRHLAMTVAPGEVRAYVNGEVVGSYDWTAPPFPPSVFFAVGRYVNTFDSTSMGSEPALNLRGYVDELRIWSSARSQREILDYMNVRVREDAPGLIAQWHFDDLLDSPNAWTTTSAQNLTLYLLDSTSTATIGSACDTAARPMGSAVAPAIRHSELPFVVISYLPNSTVEIPVPVAVNLTGMPLHGQLWASGGGGSALLSAGASLGAGMTLLYRSTAANFVQDTIVLTSGDVEARVELRCNHAPVADTFTVQTVAGKPQVVVLSVSDPDADVLYCTITALPGQGMLNQSLESASPIVVPNTVVVNRGCAVAFQSSGVGWGNGYATFQYSVQESPVYVSDQAFTAVRGSVTVNVAFAFFLPVLASGPSTALLEDSEEIQLDIHAVDLQGGIVTLLLDSLPTMGVLYRNGQPITQLVPATNRTMLWTSAVLDYSSEYFNPGGLYTVEQLLGPPKVSTYGDSGLSWSPMGNNFTSRDPQFAYTEFVTVQFPSKLYPEQMVIVENLGPKSLVRVRTPNPYSPGSWITLWMGSVIPLDRSSPITRSIPICGTPFPIDVLRLEFDLSVTKVTPEVAP
eukprot:RCo001344